MKELLQKFDEMFFKEQIDSEWGGSGHICWVDNEGDQLKMSNMKRFIINAFIEDIDSEIMEIVDLSEQEYMGESDNGSVYKSIVDLDKLLAHLQNKKKELLELNK